MDARNWRCSPEWSNWRPVALSDGSQIQLNTASAVDVKFDVQQRLIRLLSGEILMTASAD
ncbi:FecR domain-containing protein, partial [Pseudomonas viridiflava]|uniref:FecR domain-containing protein n=1 Tax=Pseudomonas viridiflava TaxID=33069 RepID=UPI00197D8777